MSEQFLHLESEALDTCFGGGCLDKRKAVFPLPQGQRENISGGHLGRTVVPRRMALTRVMSRKGCVAAETEARVEDIRRQLYQLSRSDNCDLVSQLSAEFP